MIRLEVIISTGLKELTFLSGCSSGLIKSLSAMSLSY